MNLIANAEVSENVTIDMTIDRGDVGLKSEKYDHQSGKDGSEQDAVQSDAMLHEGFRCNACKGEIVRFRYTCVQCADFDLCAACEARAQHDHHYVLRVPGPRPHAEVLETVARVRSAQRVGAPPERVTADNVTVKSEEEESPWHEDWLQDDPFPLCTAVPTVPVTEVTSPPTNRSPHKTSPKSRLKKSILRSRPAKRKLDRHQNNTSSDETHSDDSYQVVQSSETQQNLQTIQSSRIHQTVVAHKDTKGLQRKSMLSPSELEEVETEIVVQLPDRLATERHPVVRKKCPSMESKEIGQSGLSGDDENYEPDASERARRVLTVKRDGRLIRLMQVQKKVVMKALSSVVTVPQNVPKINKNTVLQNVPTVPVTEVTSPPTNRSPHKTSSKTRPKKSVLRSRSVKRKLSRHQNDTSSDDADLDDSDQALQCSRLHQTVVVHKDTKGPQTKSMLSPNKLEEVETQIVVKLPERQYHPVVRKIGTSKESEEHEESDFSGDDENDVPDVSKSDRRVKTVKPSGRVNRLMPVQRKRGNVVTRARCSNGTVPQNVAKINKVTVLQNEPYIQLERLSTEKFNTSLVKR